jgi:hypothetical protein
MMSFQDICGGKMGRISAELKCLMSSLLTNRSTIDAFELLRKRADGMQDMPSKQGNSILENLVESLYAHYQALLLYSSVRSEGTFTGDRLLFKSTLLIPVIIV